MPTDTFLHLPAGKKEAILTAAKMEFSRVSFRDASINKIIESAGISRGSFYKYFPDKKDLLYFLFREYSTYLADMVRSTMAETNGDLFSVILAIFDFTTDRMSKDSAEENLFRNIFMSMHSGDFHPKKDITMREMLEHHQKNQKIKEFIRRVDRTNLTFVEDEDVEDLILLLGSALRRAITQYLFSSRDVETVRERLNRTITMIKNGTTLRGNEDL